MKIKEKDIIHSDNWWIDGDWVFHVNPVTGEILSSYIPSCLDLDEAVMDLKFIIIEDLQEMGLLESD
jgi:hypothetical protein